MTLPASDAFTGSNWAALSASWTMKVGDLVIYSNGVIPNRAGEESAARWNADTFDNDQYSQVTYVAETAADVAIGVAARMATAAAITYYGWYASTAASYLFKVVASTWTQLGSDGASPAVNDVMRLEISGTTVTPKLNGTTADIGAQSDSAIASGAAGLASFNSSTGARIDNWAGGNLTGEPPAYQPRPPAAIDSVMVY